jgi:ABC-2 type transport system permease protein
MILGKTIPVIIICLIDLALITTIAVLWFGIPLRGSLPALVVASFLYILAGLGFGLLISTISRTQQEAFLTMFLFLLPAIILSGFLYPVETMPAFFQDLSRLNPVRYFMEVARNIFLKGHGFSELWLHFVAIGVMALGALLAAVSRFKKSLE